MYFFCVVLCDVCFVTFSVLFVCVCVLNNCHRVATQLQLNISYHIIHMVYMINNEAKQQSIITLTEGEYINDTTCFTRRLVHVVKCKIRRNSNIWARICTVMARVSAAVYEQLRYVTSALVSR
jgi:hypothetical protein